MRSILIVEDDRTISLVLKAYLEKEGYSVRQAYTCKEAKESWDAHLADLVLLDITLPDDTGWRVLHYIRERSSCPVIMLTAIGTIQDKLQGLNSGADDYITKPFIGEEVVARINAVLRRSARVFEQEDAAYFGSLKVNFKSHAVYLKGTELRFTPKDLDLLFYLLRHPNQTLSRDQLIENVWGFDYEGSERAVDLAINRIRQTLRDWPTEEGEIATIRGVGYQARVNIIS
ncbi:Transcriptional regulatory protein WalR [Paenibacillus allorhizoplanae]|uniref:Transcriptional regulatory protein WalR n=1 Tax=Paenibacillus allorhizoplanae TaxID=2905648 RepID=A0ABN8HAV3_9BACL|nr:response regulator transcription factor [Paenibacillus allorhizoplanae]CAH1230867.1 Transcriptional regulatory protein WalR [Paenibacillus allorhizoplanae]